MVVGMHMHRLEALPDRIISSFLPEVKCLRYVSALGVARLVNFQRQVKHVSSVSTRTSNRSYNWEQHVWAWRLCFSRVVLVVERWWPAARLMLSRGGGSTDRSVLESSRFRSINNTGAFDIGVQRIHGEIRRLNAIDAGTRDFRSTR